MPGRHKAGKGIYYPALLRPHGDVPHVPLGSAHPDIDPNSISTPMVEDYKKHLERVLSAPNATQYKKRQKETGIRGPSVFSVLPKALPCPKLFPADLMHLYYNLNQLLLQLWRGSIDYVGDDDPATWPFAILEDSDAFNALGIAVDCAGRCIPTCVETRIPRNPAEKINTQYKAAEYHMLVFGLCIVLFEEYYYQRKLDRLHFVRPCIHALLHIIEELIRVGSLTEVSQWMTERTIATYKRRMRLHSNPYGNLGREIAEQAGTNTIYAMEPSLRVVLKTSTPSLSLDIGSGYISLHPRDEHLMDSEVVPAYKIFCQACEWEDLVERLTPESPLTLSVGNETHIAEVQYYFVVTRNGFRHALAAVQLFSLPDSEILEGSLDVLHVCKKGAEVTFVSTKWITEVVAMVPFRRPGMGWDDDSEVNEYFLVEKTFSNTVELDDEDVDQND
ncbi:hypothetical protein PQX77_021975 [Marasmius sp. AFHP31]|nr:hypothetical protein PQX77_021975 [Marasmius sp. AFHP31]